MTPPVDAYQLEDLPPRAFEHPAEPLADWLRKDGDRA